VAISFVGSAEGSAISGGDVTLTLPAMQQGDLVIVAYSIGDNDNLDFNMAMLTADYTEVADLFSNAVLDANLGVFWKVMGATPDTTAQVDGQGGADASVAAVAMVFRGVDTTTPMDVAATTDSGIDTMHANPPSINHNNPSGVWTVIAGASAHTGGSAQTYTFPTGYTTNAVDDSEDDTTDTSVGLGYRTNPSDPEDPGVMTLSGTDGAGLAWCAVTMALRPAAANVTVTPSTAALTTATFAPTVTASDHKTATPSTASLSLATFAPSVTVGVRVTPSTASLTTATFAPTVTATQHQTVTPSTASLTTATFAPTVTASDHKTVTPTTASLTLATFAPTVTVGGDVTVTPSTAVLSITTYAPTVTATGAQPAVETAGGVRKHRRFIEIKDEEILEEIEEEEKKVRKEKKKLKILLKQVEDVPKGLLYQAEARIEKLEQKIDTRLARIAELVASMNIEDDDDEEALLLS
jgi:hypothetical protein